MIYLYLPTSGLPDTYQTEGLQEELNLRGLLSNSVFWRNTQHVK